VVTTTTHKTLRGPRGGLILCRDEYAKAVDKQIFPGIQGGPLMHVIAAKAVAFGEALKPEFKTYAKRVIENARALADSLQVAGFKIVSNGTDSHLMLVDLTPKGVSGATAEVALERAGITTNKNSIPGDPLPAMQTSGLRVGSPAGTTRGFGPAEFRQVGKWMGEVLDAVATGEDSSAVEAKVRAEVLEMTRRFPIYP
jgi:glycine hydroxymethyltransferase